MGLDDDLERRQGRWDRERDFHDALAEELDPASMPACEPVIYDEVVLQAADVGEGTRILDLGCGAGDLTLALLARGASVTALDISPGMVDLARRRVALHGQGREAVFVAAPMEVAGLPSQSFDAVVGRWILHHLDLRPAAAELARVLAPSGRVVFLENSGANPVLSFARSHIAGRFGIAKFGTVDERPLSAEDWHTLEGVFASVRREFPIFEVFGLLSRGLGYPRLLTVACEWLDTTFGRVRRLRKYSYRVLVVAEAPFNCSV